MVKQDWSKGKIYTVTCKNTNKKYFNTTTLSMEDLKIHHSNEIQKAIKNIKKKNLKYGIFTYGAFILHYIIQGENAMQYELLEKVNCKTSPQLSKSTSKYKKDIFWDETTGLNNYNQKPDGQIANLMKEVQALLLK